MPKVVAGDSGSGDNPFIYTPIKFQKKHGQHAPPVVAKGDTITYKAYLANPFAFPIHLESLSIAVEGADFDAYPVLSVTLVPHASCHEVVLSGRALTTGQIRAKGCLIQALNMIYLHAVDGRGLPVNTVSDSGAAAVNSLSGGEPPKADVRCLPREDGPENATEVCFAPVPLVLLTRADVTCIQVVIVEALPLVSLSTVGPPVRQLAFEKQLGGVEVEVRSTPNVLTPCCVHRSDGEKKKTDRQFEQLVCRLDDHSCTSSRRGGRRRERGHHVG